MNSQRVLTVVEIGDGTHAIVLKIDRTCPAERVGIVPEVVGKRALKGCHDLVVVFLETVPAQFVSLPVELAPNAPAEALRKAVDRRLHHAADEILPPVQYAEIAGQQHALGAQLLADVEAHIGHFERQVGQALMQLVARGTFVAKLCRAHSSLKQWHNVHRALRPLRATVTQNSKRTVNGEIHCHAKSSGKPPKSRLQKHAPRLMLNPWFTPTIEWM